MSESTINMTSSNYLAWKKSIDFIPIESEGIEYVKGPTSKPSPNQYQALSNYMKGEVRDQMILRKSIKDYLIPYVEKLEK